MLRRSSRSGLLDRQNQSCQLDPLGQPLRLCQLDRALKNPHLSDQSVRLDP